MSDVKKELAVARREEEKWKRIGNAVFDAKMLLVSLARIGGAPGDAQHLETARRFGMLTVDHMLQPVLQAINDEQMRHLMSDPNFIQK